MSVFRITLAALGAAVALVAAGCGGGSQSVPEGAVAVVDGTPIPRSELDKLLEQTKKSDEAQKQQFPKAGTPEYQSLQQQAVAYLVEAAELKKAAAKLGVTVTPKDVDQAEKAYIASQFGGKRSEYEKALKAQGRTEADYRTAFEQQVLSTKVFNAVTKDVRVSDKDVLAYYTQNKATLYPESREVRHILLSVTNPPGCTVGGKTKCTVDYAKSKAEADKLEKQLKAGANFAVLAKKYSQDKGSRTQGGKLSIQRGQTVPQFDAEAFALKTGQTSQPVKTVYGYHIIQALSPVTGTFDSYKNQVRQTVLQQKKTDLINAWADKMKKDYGKKVSYAKGFEPPTLPEVPSTLTE